MDNASHEQYQLLIHSLTHEHTRDNVDRHVLLFEKWSRDYEEGFYIQHLEFVNLLLSVLRDRLMAYNTMFRPVLGEILKICSKPLFESRANERLKPKSIQLIHEYFRQIGSFWADSDPKLAMDVCLCFRCIVNGGKDPTVLRIDLVSWVGDGTKLQVVDKTFIQEAIRSSGSLATIVSKFLECIACSTASILSLDESEFSKHEMMVLAASSPQQSAAGEADEDLEGAPSPSQLPGDLDSDVTSSQVVNERNDNSEASQLTQAMLNLALELTADPNTAGSMCEMRTCDGAITLLKEASANGLRSPQISECIELIWTCLECYITQLKEGRSVGEGSNATEFGNIMDFEKAINTLQYLLVLLLRDGYRLADKECRNEIIIVLTIIAEIPASFSYFMQSGLFNLLVTYACVGEAGKDAWHFYTLPLVKFRNFATAFEIDMQFKQGLWNILSDLLKGNDVDALLCIASSPLLPTMMSYLEHDSTDKATKVVYDGTAQVGFSTSTTRPQQQQQQQQQSQLQQQGSFDGSTSMHNNVTKSLTINHTGSMTSQQAQGAADQKNIFLSSLSLSQLREFQLLAIKFLAQNAPKIIGEFVRINGPIRVLDITYHYCSSAVGDHKQLTYTSLVLVNRCLSCSNIVRRIMEQENGVDTFMSLFVYNDDEPTRAQAVRLVGMLCSNHNLHCQGQVRANSGINALIQFISKYAQFRRPSVGVKAGVPLNTKEVYDLEDPTVDSSGDVSLLIVAVLDTMSKAIIGNARSEARFAREEGIDALMDLLEIAPFALRILVLRLLSDILDNQLMLSFTHAWRSAKTSRSAAQLVAHCWLDEETRLDGDRDNGIVCNIMGPLKNHVWPVVKVSLDGSVPQLSNSPNGNPAAGLAQLNTSLTNMALQDSVTFSPSSQPEMTALPSPTTSRLSGDTAAATGSVAVMRLANAILAGRTSTQGVISPVMKQMVLGRDTRGILANILKLMGLFVSNTFGGVRVNNATLDIDEDQIDAKRGMDKDFDDSIREFLEFEMEEIKKATEQDDDEEIEEKLPVFATSGDLGLNPTDKQVVQMARAYGLMREGEWWEAVLKELHCQGIHPIEADAILIKRRMQAVFDATLTVQWKQMELHDEEKETEKQQEDSFTGQIISKKNQQIKAEWLKKNSKTKSTMESLTSGF